MLFGKSLKLQKPRYDSHICVNYTEPPPDHKKHLWNKYAGQEIEFEYTNEIQTDGCYYWLPVKSEFLTDLRTELELPPLWCPLHLSLGSTHPRAEDLCIRGSRDDQV